MQSLFDSLRPFLARLGRFFRQEPGQTMVEYVLMIVLIALVVIVAIPGVTTAISNAFTAVANALSTAGGP